MIISNSSKIQSPKIQITYYTDPLCCWSWGFEPQWRRLRYEFEGLIKWDYCMGGLIPDWKSYNDPMNVVSRPVQMGPVWMEAHHVSGMPITHKIWFDDPPSSSYPACLAIKCAQTQSEIAAEKLLRKLREAVMLEGKNISKNEVIYQLAKELAVDIPQYFDLRIFNKQMSENAGVDLLKADLQKIHYHKIPRFPALTMNASGALGIIIVGYRPYNVLLDAIKRIAPEMAPVKHASLSAEYKKYWGTITDREVDEALESIEEKQ